MAIEATTPSGKVASRQIKSSASVDNGSPQLYQVTIMARYVCSVCGFIYDENQEGVSWEALPKDWACPGCGSDQSLFNLLDEDKATAQELPTSDVQASPTARNTAVEPTLELIHALARDGLKQIGRHGPMGAMGVPRPTLPQWDDIQILPAQLATKPLAENVEVNTELVIGPNAKKPLRLKIPIFVTDMSFGALSPEAKTALAKGAEMAGTGIASGEGGMLPEENAANSRYFFELGSAKFGYSENILSKVQAFHFKAGQAAKTGTGGHLPGTRLRGELPPFVACPKGNPPSRHLRSPI